MNGIEVAVKFPKIKFTLNPRYLQKFEKEVRLQAKVRVSHSLLNEKLVSITVTLPPLVPQVRHPHCVQIFAASLNPSDPFIVMEWVPGGNWFDKLGSVPPPPAHERVRAVREMASALQYLHDPLIGIIHGDIKGLNMLLMRDGSSKVCHQFDFAYLDFFSTT